ncbi:unnamed protein product [Sphagnum jensenii]|uniref:Uncharacterized protein n=1 Tax=Sphagnum jensenii TaxID=128206 RepID=A0ABP1AB93_9BRYO
MVWFRFTPQVSSSSSPRCSGVRLLRNACRRARKQRKTQRLEIVRAAGGGDTISFVSRSFFGLATAKKLMRAVQK